MAVKYCDQRLYPVYTAVPTWGVAQDGDGTSKSVATPATCSVVFTGIPSTGSIFVLGVALTVTWATSADVCANNLAAAINASTANAVSPDGIAFKGRVYNHLYARGPSAGAPSGTCQIMMRQGTANVNGQVAVTHTLNNVSSPGTINFAGGAGGAWGYLINTANIWAQPLLIAGYGIWCASGPYVGTLDPGDVIKIRAGKILSFGGANYTALIPNMGTQFDPVVFEFDDGTEWPADLPDPKFVITYVNSGNSAFTISHANGSYFDVICKRYADESSNFLMTQPSGSASSSTLRLGFSGPCRWFNVDVDCTGLPETSRGGFSFAPISSVSNRWSEFHDIRIVQPGLQGTGQPIAGGGNGQINGLKVFGGKWEMRNATSAHENGLVTYSGGSTQQFYFENFKFIGFVTGSKLFSPALVNLATGSFCVFKNCELGGITHRGPGLFQGTTISTGPGDRLLLSSTQYGKRDFSVEENGRGFYEWNSYKGFPVLNATLPDGFSKWSIFAQTSYLDNSVKGFSNAFECMNIEKFNSLADGTRVVTIEFLIESTLAWTKRDISFMISYVRPDGTQLVYNSYDLAAGAFDDSTAAWSDLAYNGQTWVRKKLQVSLPLKGSETLSVKARLHSRCLNDAQGIFLDPEVVLS